MEDHTHDHSGAHSHTHAAFAVGTLHGLAGSSHFLEALPAFAFPAQAQAAVHLIAYGAGAVLTMMSFAAVIGWMAQGLRPQGARVYQGLMVFCSAGAVAASLWWLAA